ncbi:glycosyltransferase [Candidatus Collierbacteria bacterium]|nr:glycosyltransferase [Candidatus Collierbacteria bacterium]
MKTAKQHPISIVMPVYNAARFLPACLRSIKAQTHKNWELIAVDDHSTDNSLTILKKFAKIDKRVKIFANPRNLGTSSTANLAISHARSKFIARMDADDIMYPTRLEQQLKTLQTHSSVVVLGSQCDLIDASGHRTGKKLFPTCPKNIFNMLFWACPVQQPTIMVNTNKLPDSFRWYTDGVKTGEEINFLIRISKYGSIVNSKKTFLSYRIHDTNLSYNQNQKQVFFHLFRTRLSAVIKGSYHPSFGSLILGISEVLVVTFIPSRLIMPLFQLLRGMRDFSFNLKLPAIFPNQRAVRFSA